MEVRAIARHTGIPASKVRPLVDMVRGKKVDEALSLLRFTPTPKAKVVAKLVKSAAANAENNFQMDPADLKIIGIFADEAPSMRRHRPRSRGRVSPIRKHSSHITVSGAEQEGELGHKVHPTGFRLGVIRDWQSKWYTDTHYAEFILEDRKLRDVIKSKYSEAGISLVEIDRQAKDVTIILHTARPGIVIGRGGQRVDEMRLYLEGLIGKRIRLNIQEVRQPELDAYLVARSIAEQIERRVAYRRAMRQAIFRTIQAGAKGIKVSCAGRLGNAEIARRQTSHQGQVPLHTLRADIDYGFTEAHTTLGRIGVKVWIYKGQVLPELKPTEVEAEVAEAVTEVTAVPIVQSQPEAQQVEAPADSPEAETAPVTEAKDKPKARAKSSTKTTATREKPAETAAKSQEEVPAAEKKSAKPKTQSSTKAAVTAKLEEEPAKPAARKTQKKTTGAKTEAKADKSSEEPTTAEAEPPDTIKEEAQDATT